MSNNKPLKLAILWHMHQPNYQEPGSDRMVLPWVRLHGTKDYLDMLLSAGVHENIRITFNLVPALLDQLQLYANGGTDPHLDMSRMKAEELNDRQKGDILDSFFSANLTQMIEPHRRYRELYRKARNRGGKILPSIFSSQEIRDLQVWSNMVWVDPLFRDESPIKELLAQNCNYTEEQKHTLLDWQTTILSRILPAYQKQFQQGRIDVSFTPYYHPILPLLCDTDSALEATPHITLPKRRFQHPEDAEWHIRQSMKMFEETFGVPLAGVWPSEGSISEQVADLFIKLGVKWIATDEEILHSSLRKSRMDPKANPLHSLYEYGGSLKLFFRDHALSDRIGFVYSGWDADRSATDFVGYLINLRTLLEDRLDQAVVSVILDGENAWEHFPDDGHEFLSELYSRLSDEPLIETVTMTEAAGTMESLPLPSLLAGSWINHNFRIWIGHQEDNAAWDLLHDARDTLVEFQKEHPDYDAVLLAEAWKQIYIAEGSDWCWWYGDEHRSSGNEQFDLIFRQHLMAVYKILSLEVPRKLFDPIYRAGAGLKAVPPDALLTPEIDGRITDFYEWTGAGCFDSLKAGGTMHRVQRYISRIHFAYDYDWLFIRLDFADKKVLELIDKPVFKFVFLAPETRELSISPSDWKETGEESGWYRYGLENILELAVSRTWLFEQGFGELSFTVALLDGSKRLENWPENDPIQILVADKGKEMFWTA